jgi:hypothetical protein
MNLIRVTVLASNSVDILTFNNLLILEAGDKIKMQCATGNVIKMTASVLQITRPAEVTQHRRKMPFIEQEAKSEYKIIDGKKTHVITPEVKLPLLIWKQVKNISQIKKLMTM